MVVQSWKIQSLRLGARYFTRPDVKNITIIKSLLQGENSLAVMHFVQQTPQQRS